MVTMKRGRPNDTLHIPEKRQSASWRVWDVWGGRGSREKANATQVARTAGLYNMWKAGELKVGAV